MRKRFAALIVAITIVCSTLFATTPAYAGGAWNRPVTAPRAATGTCTWIEYIAIWEWIEWCVAHYGYWPYCYTYTC